METDAYSYNEYVMRPIKAEDLKMILEWRNSPKIHSAMLTEHKITWDEHQKWFERMQKNLVKLNFLVSYLERPIGYIGYTDFNEEISVCNPGIYIGDATNLPSTAGITIQYMSVAYAFDRLNMKRVETYVLEKNEVAIKISKFIGYKEYSIKNCFISKNGQKEQAIYFVLTREDWEKRQFKR